MSKKKDKIRREFGSFQRQYERKAHSGWDPNDRIYDRKMERHIKNMDPNELSEIMSGDGSDITSEMDKLWYSFKLIPGIKFMLNDSVEITKGNYSGQRGAVISLESIYPEPMYLVELSSGEQVNLMESFLQSL